MTKRLESSLVSKEEKKETLWDKFKAANPDRDAKPWDLINPNLRVDEKIAEERFAICLECPELTKKTHQCRKCGCMMKQKTKLANASCPIGKWDVVEITRK